MAEGVTLGAQSRARHLQRVFIRRAVSLMAVKTILPYRHVLEQERSPFFRVAFVTIVVDRIFAQQSFSERPVRIVAIGAGNFALTQRHVRCTE